MNKKPLLLAISLMLAVSAFAQESTAEVQDDGRSVVVTVLGIIFLGLFGFLFVTERKLSRVEKELKEKNS